MYIRRKVYSLLQDENGEERYFSTTDFELTDGAEERYYSEKKKKKKNKISLDKVDSHRGLGRSLLIGGVPGALGAYTGKSAANKADKEGKSDEEIVEAASKKGRKAGAILGGAAGTIYAAPQLIKVYGGKKGALGAAAAGALSAGFGAAAGHFGAKKNTKERLKKRAYMEKED